MQMEGLYEVEGHRGPGLYLGLYLGLLGLPDLGVEKGKSLAASL